MVNQSSDFYDSGASRLRSRLAAAALAGTTVAMLAAPPSAPAVTRSVDYGQPGAAPMRAVRGWWNPNGGTLRIPSREVSRSPQSRETQTICAEFTLYRFTAEYYVAPWAFEATRRRCVDAASRRRARFPTWNYAALPYSSYSLSVTITWRVKGGIRLSKALYDYDRVEDYRCETKNCASALRYAGVASMRFES
jgi:hypothetical protein